VAKRYEFGESGSSIKLLAQQRLYAPSNRVYAGANFSPAFLFLLPPAPVFPLLQGAIAPCRSPKCEVRNAGRGASCVFQFNGPDSFRSRNTKSVAGAVILRFTFGHEITDRYAEPRTSYVLGPPRILSDARCPQHACQGFQPVDPTREGLPPLVWTLPAEARRGGVA
jgi:hypothetical protein